MNHHYATVLNLYRRRAGKSWLTPVAETHELTLRALACVAPDTDKVSEGELEAFLPTAMALFEILNSNDAEVNVDEVDRLLARLWRSDHNVALSVYGKTSFKETFYEAASELLDAGAKPLKVIGLLADALQTRHMEVGSGYSIPKKVKRSVKGSVKGSVQDPSITTPPMSVNDVPAAEGETPSETGGPLKKKRKKGKAEVAVV